jgi:hypothetical protein
VVALLKECYARQAQLEECFAKACPYETAPAFRDGGLAGNPIAQQGECWLWTRLPTRQPHPTEKIFPKRAKKHYN